MKILIIILMFIPMFGISQAVEITPKDKIGRWYFNEDMVTFTIVKIYEDYEKYCKNNPIKEMDIKKLFICDSLNSTPKLHIDTTYFSVENKPSFEGFIEWLKKQ